MSTTLPAMRCRMGNTDYYLLSIKAGELVRIVQEPKDMPGWDDEKIEEIYQRTINYHRVRTQIAPYLAQQPNARFFGSIIIAAFNFDEKVVFEPLSDLPTAPFGAHRNEAASKIGMLTLSGDIMMAPLDGQHRLKALKFAMTGLDNNGVPIHGIKVDLDLAREDIAVILLPYVPEKARRIFTRVNRYARRPTAAETYVTDDEDIFAILARRVANTIGGRLVEFRQTTLGVKSPQFTTLSILYGCCKVMIESLDDRDLVSAATRLEPDAVESCGRLMDREWDLLLKKITVFSDLTADPSEDGDDKRKSFRRRNLLGKPVPQECLVRAYLALIRGPTRLSRDRACERLNEIPWAMNTKNLSQVWQYVLWSGGVDRGRILTKNRQITSRLIAYMAGEELTETEQKRLLDDYRELFPDEDQAQLALPPKVPSAR